MSKIVFMLLVVAVCSLFSGSECSSISKRQPKSTATQIPITSAPWMVRIEYVDGAEEVILGSIVGPNLVLTTTLRIEHLNPGLFNLRAGVGDASKSGSFHNITKIFPYQNFVDIGLLTVDPPFQLDATRQIIPLGFESPIEGDAMIYSFDDDKNLIVTDGYLVERVTCDNYLWPIRLSTGEGCVQNDQICAEAYAAAIVKDGALIGHVSDPIICGDLSWPILTINYSVPMVSMWLRANVPTVTLP